MPVGFPKRELARWAIKAAVAVRLNGIPPRNAAGAGTP